MDQFVRGSRVFLLGAMFMGVLTGAGGLAGAIAGAILALLVRTVMGVNEGTGVLMLVAICVGAAAAVSLGLYLMARHTPRFALQPRLTPIPIAEPEQLSS